MIGPRAEDADPVLSKYIVAPPDEPPALEPSCMTVLALVLVIDPEVIVPRFALMADSCPTFKLLMYGVVHVVISVTGSYMPSD